MTYTVIKKFRDLQDKERIYEVGDTYEGKDTKKRIAELTTKKNKIGEPLIEADEAPDDPEETENQQIENVDADPDAGASD